jgi:hemerythrin-like domain-containing protein
MLGDCHRRIERFLDVQVTLATREKGGRLTESTGQLWRPACATSAKHTADEEESLFPRLRRIDFAKTQAILARIDSLEQDHERAGIAHDEVDQLGRRWLTSGRLSPEDPSRLCTVLDQLATLYRNHIAIEDSEVFPFAASILDASERKSVGVEMAARRGAEEPAPTVKSR